MEGRHGHGLLLGLMAVCRAGRQTQHQALHDYVCGIRCKSHLTRALLLLRHLQITPDAAIGAIFHFDATQRQVQEAAALRYCRAWRRLQWQDRISTWKPPDSVQAGMLLCGCTDALVNQ